MATTQTARPVVIGPAQERISPLVATLAFVLVLHLLGWGLLLGWVAPHHFELDGEGLGLGLGLTAYTLGMRHAFDADHIAAIDNTSRKLMAEGKNPVTAGFWFSLGHSSVVFIMVLALAAGVRVLSEGLGSGSSTLRQVAGIWGTAVSGGFLLLIGLINLAALVGIVRVFRRMRTGVLDEAELERHLQQRGAMYRILGRTAHAVREPWHLYPVGFLFGLGFDTVSEIGLLVMAGGAVAASIPWWAVLPLPILFAAGMSLLDTLDGAFMTKAYGWAFDRPFRKVFYNMTVTGLSVAIALIIGGIQVAGLLAAKLDSPGAVLRALASVDLNHLGYAIVALFVLTWAVSLTVWRVCRLEQRWAGDGPG